MAADRAYVAENEAALRRLRSLVERLGDAELARPLPDGWTVAAALAHVAFWDQRVLSLLDRWERGETPRPMDPADVDWINEAGKPLCLGLSPRTAARLAVAIGDAVDRRLARLTDAQLAANDAAGAPIFLLRSRHRSVHLDEIERALGG
jgi:hypothetical protein